MRSKPEELRDRTKAFALRIIRLFRSLPYRTDTQVLGKQLLRWKFGCRQLPSGMPSAI